jgi:hypothetical protein
MRRTLLLAAVGLAVLGLVTGGAGAAATPSDRLAGRTLRLVQSAPQVAVVDLNDPGPSPGDVLVFRSELLDETNTQPVGDLNITCTQAIGPENICRGIFTITGRGQLSVDALPVFPQATVGIVNGGNGQFRLSRGEVVIEPQADGTTLLTFRLFA